MIDIQVYDLRPTAPPSSERSLTVAMIDRDGYGRNLTGPYSTDGISVILSKTAEYNRLTGESNDPCKLVFRYRVWKLGVVKALVLTTREAAWRAMTKLARKLEDDPYL